MHVAITGFVFSGLFVVIVLCLVLTYVETLLHKGARKKMIKITTWRHQEYQFQMRFQRFQAMKFD